MRAAEWVVIVRLWHWSQWRGMMEVKVEGVIKVGAMVMIAVIFAPNVGSGRSKTTGSGMRWLVTAHVMMRLNVSTVQRNLLTATCTSMSIVSICACSVEKWAK